MNVHQVRWLLDAGRRAAPVLALALFASTLAGGCSLGGGAKGLAAENRALKQRVSELERQLEEAKEALEEEVTVYVVKSTPADFWLVPEIRRIPRRPDTLKAALEELIRAPSNPFPKETKVLDVRVKDFVAYPNFSREVTRLSAGAKIEALAVAAIANTLIKFPGVEKVQILVEGRPVESLAGHVDVSKPVGRDEAVLLLKEGGGRAAPGAGEWSRSDCIDAARVTDIRWLNGRPVGLIPRIRACRGDG